MTDRLSLNIKQLIDDQNLSIQGLEKKSGLKTNAVRNILTGHSKKPSAEILLAISRVLGCSVEDLYGEKSHEQSSAQAAAQETPIQDKALFEQTCQEVLRFHQENALPFTAKQFLDDVIQIYFYCLQSQTRAFDERFAQWLLSKKLR